MFKPVEGSVSFPKLEEEIIALWKQGPDVREVVGCQEHRRRHLFFMKARPRPTDSPIRATA